MGVTWWNLQSQLLVAIHNDDALQAKQLLAAGVDCDARFSFGSLRRPAVCLCVERDSLNLVRLLLDWGCSVNQSDTKGQTALHLAAGRGHIQLLDLLLRNRASVLAVDEQNRTPLHWAAQRSSSEIAQLLLQHGADVDRPDQDGRTPLLLACLHGSSATAQLLLSHGADPNAVDHLGNTALHFAVGDAAPDLNFVKSLIQAGAAVNSLNTAGLTPLHVAVRGVNFHLRSELLKLLADAGSDLDKSTPLGHTALHTAVLERDEASALLLLRLQARPNTADRLGLPPLFHAARDGNLRLVQALLAAGAHLDLRQQSWIRDPRFISEIQNPKILQLISVAANTCPRLTWLARSSFRTFAREKSVPLASTLQYPNSLTEFLNFSDVLEDWI